MGKVWRILALIPGADGGDPAREYYFVAIDDPAEAMAALRRCDPDLPDAELSIHSETTLHEVEWAGIKEGDIFCFMTVS
jgi:hypothetical protein